jgi:heavy metal-binding protein
MNSLSRVVALVIVMLAAAPFPPHAQAPEPITGWFCPMHPDHTSNGKGMCPICGMALIAGNPYDTRDYVLDFTTSPAAVASGTPFKMIFKVRHPGSGDAVKSYEIVHDKRYHLFVVSQDMAVFQHLHPELQADGSWEMGLTLPKAGYYRVLSDFVPSGGSPQFLGRTLVTTDFDEDLESQAGRLEPDAFLKKTVDSITASVELEPVKLIAGQYGHFRFTLTDSATGEPITDLQPYLGAFGHTLILSEDMLDYVHSHPSEGTDDISRGFGGPRVTFEGFMPRPGRYRAWTQFLRKDQLTTISFTFSVLTLDDAVRTQQ